MDRRYIHSSRKFQLSIAYPNTADESRINQPIRLNFSVESPGRRFFRVIGGGSRWETPILQGESPVTNLISQAR